MKPELQSLLEQMLEARRKTNPSAGLSQKQKSAVVKKAKAGKDIGKKGKGFEALAKKAGGGEKGKRIAAAAMWKNIKRESINESEDLISVLATILAGASFSTWAGFSWAKSLLGIPEFKNQYSQAQTKNEKIEILKKYLTYVFDPSNIGSYTNKMKDQNINESQDHEVSMAISSLKSIIKSSVELMKKLGDQERNIPGWIQDHITNAENYIDQAAQGFHELGE